VFSEYQILCNRLRSAAGFAADDAVFAAVSSVAACRIMTGDLLPVHYRSSAVTAEQWLSIVPPIARCRDSQ